MKAAIKSKNINAGMILSVLIPIFLYWIVLILKIPYSFSQYFSRFSFSLFLLVLLLYYLSFRMPVRYGVLTGLGLTMLLSGLTLSYLWSSGYSNDKILGGLLPFRDGFDYYNGAKLLLSGNLITNINEGAAYRPLYPGFLSAVLMMTGQNFQWALAIQVGIAGICFSLSAYFLRNLLGAAAAAVYITLLYFYIQPLLGTVYTETLGLAFGCLGLVLLWTAAKNRSMHNLVFGLIILMIAVSVRAGAFFIFPVLVLWAGWAFRGQKRFSFRSAGIALVTIVGTYLVANTLFSKLVVQPGGYSFGNFAWTIYGQVAGGAGYHKAFEVLGVRNPNLIFRAAGRFFLAHPFSFVIGAAKAYRDFFLPQIGILTFSSSAHNSLWDILLWAVGSCLLFLGLFRSAKKIILPEFSLLIAGFIGIFLSIPFLPPIDGGVRIYASTMPFFFALPAVAIAEILSDKQEYEIGTPSIRTAGVFSILLTFLTICVPVLIFYLTTRPTFVTPACTSEQAPYAAIVSKGSYIDLLPDGPAACGAMPRVCASDFQANRGSTDPSNAMVYDEIISLAANKAARLFPAEDMVEGQPHLFIGTTNALNVPNNSVITGCATEIFIKGRPSIYSIQTASISNLPR